MTKSITIGNIKLGFTIENRKDKRSAEINSYEWDLRYRVIDRERELQYAKLNLFM